MFSDAINSAKKYKNETDPEIKEVIRSAYELINSCGVAMVGNYGPDGYPQIKAMLIMETEGIKKFWFSTNTSSKRVSQFLNDERACLYFMNEQEFKGLMLVGKMQVLNDEILRKHFWREGAEIYYPLGVNDPDYSILCFTARYGNFYHGLKNTDFEV